MEPARRRRGSRRRLALAAVLALAAAVRIVDAVEERAHSPYWTVPVADCKFYDDWALALARGEGAGDEAFWQPPLYPTLLGGLYRVLDAVGLLEHRFDVVFALQLLLGLLNVYLVASIGRRVFCDAAGWLGALLFALYPGALFWETKLLITTVGTFLGLLSLRLLLSSPRRPRRTPAAGFFLGLLCTARADRLAFLPLAAAWLGFAAGRRRARAVLLLLAAAAVPIGAVFLRNVVVAGEPVPIAANGGVNLYFGNHPGASGINMGTGLRFGSLFTQRRTARETAAEGLGGKPEAIGDAEASAYFVRRVLSFWRDEPAEAARVFVRKLRLSLSDLEADIAWLPAAEAPLRPAGSRLPVTFGVLLGLGVAGAWLALRRRGGPLLLLHVASTFAVLLLFFMGARFRVPTTPVLAALGGGFLASLPGALRRTPVRAVGLAVLAVLVALHARAEAARFRLAPDEPPLARLLEANASQILGQAFAETGRIAEARETFRRVLELNPFSFKARHALGRLALEQARSFPLDRRADRLRWLDIARRHFEQAARLLPTWPDPHVGLAEVALDRVRRDPAEALRHLDRALELAPGDIDYLVKRARVLILLGRIAEAASVLGEIERRRPQHPALPVLRRELERRRGAAEGGRDG